MNRESIYKKIDQKQKGILSGQFLSFVKKEFYHVFRDYKTLLMLFGLPIAQILLFGFALTNEVKNSKLIICDFANDPSSQQITQRLEASSYFETETRLLSISEIENEFKRGKAKIAIVFPVNFHQDLFHENKAQLQLIADASDPNTANTLSQYASRVILDYQMDFIRDSKIPYQINTETRMVYNPELKGTTNYVPGVMALVLLLVCVLMTSVSIVREKENGTMEILLVSPFNPVLVIIAKATPYFILSILNLTVILVLSTQLLQMPIQGSLILLYTASVLFILTALSLGLLISTITASQQAAMLISLMGMLMPTIMFSGFMFPLENMPMPLQIISNILPSKWYYIIAKSIMIKGLNLWSIWKEMLILTLMTLGFLTVSIKKFNKRLA